MQQMQYINVSRRCSCSNKCGMCTHHSARQDCKRRHANTIAKQFLANLHLLVKQQKHGSVSVSHTEMDTKYNDTVSLCIHVYTTCSDTHHIYSAHSAINGACSLAEFEYTCMYIVLFYSCMTRYRVYMQSTVHSYSTCVRSIVLYA